MIKGLWKSDPATAQAGHGTKDEFYVLTAPNGKSILYLVDVVGYTLKK